jgi:hypothetical protein
MMRWFAFFRQRPGLVPSPLSPPYHGGATGACPDLHIQLYSRSPCPLCDEARGLLRHFQRRYGFTLEVRNVDDSDELRRVHGDWVPVVVIEGRLRFRGHVNPVLLQRILDAAVQAPG